MARPKIFVVHDEPPIADLLSEFLRDAPCYVETFYDADSALRRADRCAPDILITDFCMPDISGIALASAFRERKPSCKVILISGNSDWKCTERLHADEAGIVLLRNPFKIEQLLRLVGAPHKPGVVAA